MIASVEKLIQALKQPTSWQEVQNKKLLGEMEEFGEMMSELAQPEEEAEVLEILLCALNEMDVYRACCISHFCGYLLEKNGMPKSSDKLVSFYVKILKLAYSSLESAAAKLGIEEEDLDREQLENLNREEIFAENPDPIRAYQGCDMATLAVMDVITRSMECRTLLRESSVYHCMEELQNFISNVFYPLNIHDACWELPLVVIAPEEGRGFEAVLNDLCNNFQVMAFLEQEICRKHWALRFGIPTCRFGQKIYDYLTGAAYPEEQGSVVVHSGYTSYDGVMIWGEMAPETIPQLDGKAVIVMKKEGMIQRSFDVQFLLKWHEALNPYFKIVRELSPEEVKEWSEKIAN